MEVQDVRGFCNFQDIYLHFVQQAQDGDLFVEVGSLWGSSAAWMASFIRESGKNIKFYVVDYFDLRGITDGKWSQEDLDYVRYLGNITEDEDVCYESFWNVLSKLGLRDYVTPIKMASNKAVNLFADNSIDFLFIDADHSYEGVKRDIQMWIPKVRSGGVIAGHDYDWEGVKKAVDELFANTKITPWGSSWLVQK